MVVRSVVFTVEIVQRHRQRQSKSTSQWKPLLMPEVVCRSGCMLHVREGYLDELEDAGCTMLSHPTLCPMSTVLEVFYAGPDEIQSVLTAIRTPIVKIRCSGGFSRGLIGIREGTLDAGGLADNLYAADGAIDGSTPREIRDALSASANGMEGARFGVEIEDAESALASLESSIVRYLSQ